MTAEKRGCLLKYCDCENIKEPFDNDPTQKPLYITGILISLVFIGTLCFFSGYNYVRLNTLEVEFKNMEQALKKMMRNDTYSDSHVVRLARLLEDNRENEVLTDPEYLDYEHPKPELSFTDEYPLNKMDYETDSDGFEDDNDNDYIEEDYEDVDNILRKIQNGTDSTESTFVTERNKRSVVAATKDGILINSQSYAVTKAKNLTTENHSAMSVNPVPARPSTFGRRWPYYKHSEKTYQETKIEERKVTENPLIATKKPSVVVRRSRVMHSEDSSKAFRRIFKKPVLKSGDTEYDSYFHSEEITSTASTVSQENRHKRLGRSRPLISIQYNGDTSQYIFGKHENFKGNGRLRHLQKKFVHWVPSNWASMTGMDAHFSLTEGVVTIKDTGLYYIYAQIYYLDEHDRTGYGIYKNSAMILQCAITQHSPTATLKGNTCYTAGIDFLTAGDTIYLSDVISEKYTLFEPGKSFFGLVKLGDFKTK